MEAVLRAFVSVRSLHEPTRLMLLDGLAPSLLSPSDHGGEERA